MSLTYRDMLQHVTAMQEDGEDVREGQTYSRNHEDCPAGIDRKRRFYITKKHGDYLCYCQHCGKGGVFSGKKDRRFEEEVVPTPHGADVWKKYKDRLKYAVEWDGWCDDMKLWWLSYEMDEVDASTYNVYADRQLLYVLCSMDVILARNFSAGAKYIRVQQQGFKGYEAYVHSPYHPLFITEDVMSAIKLHKAGYNSLTLLGTRASAEALSYIMVAIGNKCPVYVWLDDDSAGKYGAVQLYKDLASFGDVLTIDSPREAKETELSLLRDLHYIRSIAA